MQAKTLTLTHPRPLGRVERSDIESVQISILFIKQSTKNSWQAFDYDLYDSKVNFGVREMGFMFL